MEEDEDLVITLEGISTSTLAHLTGRFYRWLGKKLPLGADVRAIQVGIYKIRFRCVFTVVSSKSPVSTRTMYEVSDTYYVLHGGPVSLCFCLLGGYFVEVD